MKNYSATMIALAVVLATGPAVFADTFNYIYSDPNGVTAKGTLSGSEIGSSGAWDITAGTITLTGSTIDGSGVLVAPVGGLFETGGGTNVFGIGDSNLYPYANPEIDAAGAFTFDLTSGPGDGLGVVLASWSADDYGIFGGNWNLDDNFTEAGAPGRFTTAAANVVATPELSTWLLLGTGLLCLAFLTYGRRRPTGGLQGA